MPECIIRNVAQYTAKNAKRLCEKTDFAQENQHKVKCSDGDFKFENYVDKIKKQVYNVNVT